MNTRENIVVGDIWKNITQKGRPWWRVDLDLVKAEGRGKGKGGGKKVKKVDTTNLVVKSGILL